MFYRRAKQDIDGEKMPFSNEKTMDHAQKSTFFTAMLHSKCISKMYYQRRFTFSFLSIRYTSQFGIIFALINDSPCDSVLFSTILYICMHSIRPAAYLPSAFLGARFAITFSIMTSYIYLFIYFSSSSFGAMPCHANPFLIRSQSLSIFMGVWMCVFVWVWIELSFRYLLLKISAVTWEPIILYIATIYSLVVCFFLCSLLRCALHFFAVVDETIRSSLCVLPIVHTEFKRFVAMAESTNNEMTQKSTQRANISNETMCEYFHQCCIYRILCNPKSMCMQFMSVHLAGRRNVDLLWLFFSYVHRQSFLLC